MAKINKFQIPSGHSSFGIWNLNFGIWNLPQLGDWNLFLNQFINHAFKDKAMKRQHGVPIQFAPKTMRFESGCLV